MDTLESSNIIRESTLSLAEAAKRIPPFRPGRAVSVSCITRWILQGVRTPQGRLRLEAVRIGGRWVTSLEALERFIAGQTPNLADRLQLPRTPAARRRAIERAEARLQKIGL
jgi:hypothetical protein